MKGMMHAVARIALMDGFVRFLHAHGPASMTACAADVAETAISGEAVEQPLTRMQTFARFASDLGLVAKEDDRLSLTADGILFAELAEGKWAVSRGQAAMLRHTLRERPVDSPVLFGLAVMLQLVKRWPGLGIAELAAPFAAAVGQVGQWRSPQTREDKVKWALTYLAEMECVERTEEGRYRLTAVGEGLAVVVAEALPQAGAEAEVAAGMERGASHGV